MKANREIWTKMTKEKLVDEVEKMCWQENDILDHIRSRNGELEIKVKWQEDMINDLKKIIHATIKEM